MPSNDKKSIKQYMVQFNVPFPFPEELYKLIPVQRSIVDNLLNSGKLLSYSLSFDKMQIWVVFLAVSESELLSLIDKLPLTSYMDFDYCELMFHQSLRLLPSMSLN